MNKKCFLISSYKNNKSLALEFIISDRNAHFRRMIDQKYVSVKVSLCQMLNFINRHPFEGSLFLHLKLKPKI